MSDKKRHDSIIAAAVTFVFALALLLWLFFGSVDYDRSLLASASTPEIELLPPEEPEEFIEPEILSERGEPEATNHDEPAPTFKGVPEKAEEENPRPVVKGRTEKPAPPAEKPVTQTKPSPVKAVEPSKTDEDRKKAASKLAGKFPEQNGAATGTTSTGGSGGSGVGISGSVNGRSFRGCPKPDVELRNKVVVEVRVTIDSSGRVVAATARSKSGSPSASILRACERAAMAARWSEDPAVPSAKGTLTFTITPR